VLGLAGIIGLYLVLRELDARRPVALVGALTLAANPIYFALAFTFMTDVPFTAAATFSLLFFLRHLRTARWGDLAAAALLATVATLCRQIGLHLSIAFLPAALLVGGRRRWLQAAVPLVVSLGALLAYPYLLRLWGDVPLLYGFRAYAVGARLLGNPSQLLAMISGQSVVASAYVGLFLVPFLLLLMPRLFKVAGGRISVIVSTTLGLSLALLSIVLTVGRGRVMPLVGNILTISGIGPITLRDVYVLGLRHVPECPVSVHLALSVVAIAFGAMAACLVVGMVTALLRREQLPAASQGGLRGPDGRQIGLVRPQRAVLMFLLAACGIYALPVLFERFYDRYLIALLPALLAAMCAAARPRIPPRFLTGAAILLCAGTLAFSVAATHDYLAWNRARWSALDMLTKERGIPPTVIDGGFEFNGWHLHRRDYRPRPGKSWWWVEDDLYMVAMGPVEGYQTIDHRPFVRWLPARRDEILILRRQSNAD
jgi:hypothetical protein